MSLVCKTVQLFFFFNINNNLRQSFILFKIHFFMFYLKTVFF